MVSKINYIVDPLHIEEIGHLKVLFVHEDQETAQSKIATMEQIKGVHVVGVAESKEYGFRLAKDHRPQVLILHITGPYRKDLDWVKKIRKTCINTRVIALTEQDLPLLFHLFMEAGVSNLLRWNATPAQLLQVIMSTLNDTIIVSCSSYRKLRRISSILSDSELHTLALAAIEYTNRDISYELHVSLRTVESRFTKIYEKLEVSSRKEAINVIMNM